MEKKSWVMLVLAAAVILTLTVGVAYGMMGQPRIPQGGPNGGSSGRYGYGTGMIGTCQSRPGGMMGGFSGMMGGYGGMGPCSYYGTGYPSHPWNSSWSGTMVMIVNDGFYPPTLTISKGTTVTWVNMDFVQHTVTSGSEQSPTGLFDSHELSHMQSFSYTSNTPGTYTYFCDIHPGMVGTIIVN